MEGRGKEGEETGDKERRWRKERVQAHICICVSAPVCLERHQGDEERERASK